MRKIYFVAIRSADKLDGFFQHGHHAKPQQIHFDDAHVRAILFIPLDDYAAGHGGGFERNHGIQLALTDDHSSGMLAEMARQVLYSQVEIEELGDDRILWRKTGFAKLALGGFFGIGP